MRRAGASLLVGGDTNLAVCHRVCVFSPAHMRTHACEGGKRERRYRTGEKEKRVRAQRPIKFLLAF